MPALPPEVLYDIIARITAEYIDDVVAGPLSMPRQDIPSIMDQQTGNQNDEEGAAVNLEQQVLFGLLPDQLTPDLDEDDPVTNAPNPIIPLLTVSYQYRRTTLKVLSDALGIPLNEEGIAYLTSKPWTRIHQLRLCYSKFLCSESALEELQRISSPLVQTYMTMCITSWRYRMAVFFHENSHLDPHWNRPRPESPFALKWLAGWMMTVLSYPFMIKQPALRTVVLTRIADLSMEVFFFMTFKVLMAMIQSLRGTFTRVDSIIDGLDQRGGDRAEVNALYADIITALTSALQDFQTQDLYMCAAQMTFKRALGSTFESTIDIKTVISARSIMDSIIDYKVQPNFDYSRCTELAADIRDKIKTRIPENAKVDGVSS